MSAIVAWNVIADALRRGWLVGCDTPGTPLPEAESFKMTDGHAHSVIGMY